MSLRNGLPILCCLLFSAESALASATIRRYVLAAGANYGGAVRPTLRYAVSDAESFARVMETLGGVFSSDLVLLEQPGVIELEVSCLGYTSHTGARSPANPGPIDTQDQELAGDQRQSDKHSHHHAGPVVTPLCCIHVIHLVTMT